MRKSLLSPSQRTAILASLSATGATLAASQSCQAELVTIPVNVNIGFGPGESTSYTVNTLPGAAISFVGIQPFGPPFKTFSFQQAAGNVGFRHSHATIAGAPLLANLPAGKTYGQVGNGGGTRGVFATVSAGGYQTSNATAGQPFYAAFKFYDTTRGGFDYGFVDGTLTNGSFNGYSFNIGSIVYDNGGAPFGAGPSSVVPEPSSLVLGAIGAMVLGASGVRKWKKDKAAAKTAPALA